MTNITIHVSFRGTSHLLSVDTTTTLADFQAQIESLTSVPPALQKLLYKGKKASNDGDESHLDNLGVKDGTRITLVGSTAGEIEGMRATEAESQRRENIMRQRQARGPSKLASTSRQTVEDLKYRFHRVEPLPHLPKPETAKRLLEKLANDPAILDVMKMHKFTVGVLTELAPHEHPELLGLNENAGQVIRLRIRTNAYDGMRLYSDVRRVLCHELSHNVHGDHDDNFKTLNSLLNREVAAFEKNFRDGAHTLSGLGDGDYYEPQDIWGDVDEALQPRVLGGEGAVSSAGQSREEIRARTLAAVQKRLAKEEQEIEEQCGTHS